MTTRTQVMNKLAMSLIVSALFAVPAKAEPQGQYFAHITPAAKEQAPAATQKKKEEPVQGALAICSPRTPIVDWFEKMDEVEYEYSATRADRALLERPFNEESERVHQWTQTASKVANNYRFLATILGSMDIPKDGPLLKQFRDEKADWYKDTAGVLEDLTRPRKPAKTQEELDSQTRSIEQRAVALRTEQQELHELDRDMRKQYKVHMAFYTDALQQYINGTVPPAK